MVIHDLVMFGCGSPVGLVYVFIPMFYFAFFLCLLLGTIVLQFSAKCRPWSSCVFVGALTSIPGFLLGCAGAALTMHCANQMTFANFFPKPVPEISAISIFLAPFGFAAIGTLLGFFVGFRAKRRRSRVVWS
jgi:hypothetical protein